MIIDDVASWLTNVNELIPIEGAAINLVYRLKCFPNFFLVADL